MYAKGKGSAAAQRERAKYGKTRRRKARKQADREERRRRRDQRQRQRQEDAHDTLGTTAAARYAQRKLRFAERFGAAGGLLHRAAWLAHNCVAHPLLGAFPGPRAVRLHDRTADWLNLSETATTSPLPDLARRRDWIVHNCLVHPLIGLAPQPRLLDAHDVTAQEMGVDGWV